jgi:epsilon-lactone hydrolase
MSRPGWAIVYVGIATSVALIIIAIERILEVTELPRLLAAPQDVRDRREAQRTDAVTPDPFVAPEAVERTNLAYADGVPFPHPTLDLLGADMRGRPPVLVQTGALECDSGDAELLGSRTRAGGAPCEVQLWPGQIHAFMAFRIPEGRAAFAYGARFLADPPGTRRGAA